MADTRTLLAQDIQREVNAQYGDGVQIFKPVIRRSVRFGESAAAGQSILAYDPKSAGAKAYLEVAESILEGKNHG